MAVVWKCVFVNWTWNDCGGYCYCGSDCVTYSLSEEWQWLEIVLKCVGVGVRVSVSILFDSIETFDPRHDHDHDYHHHHECCS